MDPILVQDFTTDHARVGQRLRYVQAFGQTPFYDGVHQGIARLDNSHYPDRVAIIFTDDVSGVLASSSLDNASKSVTRDDLVSSALNSQNRFFVVGVGQPDASQHSVAVSIGSWSIGGSDNGVGAEDLNKFATDSGAGFFLIAAEPDKNAPKVATSAGQKQSAARGRSGRDSAVRDVGRRSNRQALHHRSDFIRATVVGNESHHDKSESPVCAHDVSSDHVEPFETVKAPIALDTDGPIDGCARSEGSRA